MSAFQENVTDGCSDKRIFAPEVAFFFLNFYETDEKIYMECHKIKSDVVNRWQHSY